MKSMVKPLLIAALLAAAGFSAFSQPRGNAECRGMMGGGGPMHEGMGKWHMGKMDPSKMQARMDKRNAVLKAQLKITPEQESAWTAYTTAMTPPTELMAKHPDPAEMAKLPTPERIDKMKALRSQHMSDMTTAMDKRGEATKALYAALTPEQQKVFDSIGARQQGPKGPRGGPRDGSGAGMGKQ